MDFSVKSLKIRSESLDMDFYKVPWDSEIIGRPIGEISQIKVGNLKEAEKGFIEFDDWLGLHNIQLCYSRIKHDQLLESSFLQKHGFKFIELNYHPRLAKLQDQEVPDQAITIKEARSDDQGFLAKAAGHIFKHGRYHQDLLIGPDIGNIRYKIWLENSFMNPDQVVYKCIENDEIVGFFVVEYPEENACYWSLIGLLPGFNGRGIGTRVWKAMMRFHQSEGMDSITTSISSHNVAVFNLYIKLGFKYPLPEVTFHWHAQ